MKDGSTSDEPYKNPQVHIPALVVSGFLGAGKTTLIRNLLKDAQKNGCRMAVVSNEFGALGVDQALFGQDEDSRYVELEGGCVCCQLSDELLTTLHDLWERHKPDRVIVETSGVALPFETLVTFWREPVAQWVGEALAVVVVNAEQLLQKQDIEGTAEQQISSADILVLNKVDLVKKNLVSGLQKTLEDMAPGTPILHSVNAQVDPAILFPPHASVGQKKSSQKSPEVPPHTHEEFQSQEISIEPEITENNLMLKLKTLTAIRIKGVVKTVDGLRLVQGVGSRIQLVDPPSNFPDNLIGKVIAIRRSSKT